MKKLHFPTNKKLNTVIAGGLLLLITIATILHFWFVNNTEKIFENIVATQSQGKIRLHVKKVSLNYFNRNIRLQQAQFLSADSTADANTYQFHVADLRLKVKSIPALLWRKEILLDSLTLHNPQVIIRHISDAKPETTDTSSAANFSIAQEMGKIYQSIRDALNILQIKYFQVNEGSFRLVNMLRPADPPIHINRIFLQVDNIEVNEKPQREEERFLFSENIILKTRDQSIQFPGGRHSLRFGAFEMNVKDKKIEIDSCFIVGERTDSSRVAFDMFFNKLQLLNFDFAALANKDLIKADSVYCLDPEIRLSLLLKNKTFARSEQPFQLDELLRQAGSNMDLKFAGLSNADIEVTTTRNNNPVTLRSKGNDIFLYNFLISNQKGKPVKLGGIDVAIRNYDMVTRDGNTAIKFDSIQLRNNTIRLNNFSLTPVRETTAKNIRHIDVPLLVLNGLSWEHLLANRTIVADKAILYNPNISYKRQTPPTGRRSFYAALAGIDDLMQVSELELYNGNLQLELSPQQIFKLQQANFSIQSNQFVSSQSISHIEQSINRFNFSKGTIKLNNTLITLDDIEYGNEENLKAGLLLLQDVNSRSSATLSNVSLWNLQVNEVLKTFYADSIGWSSGKIQIFPIQNNPAGKKQVAEINIQHITGKETDLKFDFPDFTLQTLVQSATANNLRMGATRLPLLENLLVEGRGLQASIQDIHVNSGEYRFLDNQTSHLNNLRLERLMSEDTLLITTPTLHFITSFNKLTGNKIIFDSMALQQPVIYASKNGTTTNQGKFNLTPVLVKGLLLNQPTITVSSWHNRWHLLVNKKNKTDLIRISGLQLDSSGLHLSKTLLQSGYFTYENEKHRWGTDSGYIKMLVNQVDFQPQPSIWLATLELINIRKPYPIALGNDKELLIDSMQVEQLKWQSTDPDMASLVLKNPNLELKGFFGKITDPGKTINIYNGSYRHANKMAAMDSLKYLPQQIQDRSKPANLYQADKFDAQTGSVTITGFDLHSFLSQNALNIQTLQASRARINVFRNKLLPRASTEKKHLPTASLKKMKGSFNIDSINLSDAEITYTEISDFTKDTGTAHFTMLNARSGPYKNTGIRTTDSLRVEADAMLLAHGQIGIRFHQSYTDTSGGFRLRMTGNFPDAEKLTPLLKPLTGVSITSGQLDSLWLTATGNDQMAYGEMMMQYSRLKIFTNSGDDKRSFKDKLKSFIANKFIVRSHNLQQKPGIIYFERWPDRSVFNFFVKILVSGVSTSIGLKSNAKQVREYELHKRSVQPASPKK